jgi:hypothetical protein
LVDLRDEKLPFLMKLTADPSFGVLEGSTGAGWELNVSYSILSKCKRSPWPGAIDTIKLYPAFSCATKAGQLGCL